MLIPIILSGGSGTRLWPVSRESHPKPFMKLPDGLSLLQKTFMRASELPDVTEILTVTNRDYFFSTKDEYSQIYSLTNKNININFLLEPKSRNTAPAIAMAALKVLDTYGDDAVMLVMAADHLVEGIDAFNRAVMQAYELSQNNYLSTFGIKPVQPETGYGYIECGSSYDEERYHVARFIEKPSLDYAVELISSERYLWNSGMFCFKASAILENLCIHANDIYQAALACWEQTKSKGEHQSATTEIDEHSFHHIEDISIDYAVMEKADNIVVVRADFTWSDIGSWDAVSKLAESDNQGNRVCGEAILVDTHNTYIQSENRLVAAIGLKDVFIVDSPDALLVAHQSRAQDVKKVVAQLKLQDHESYKLHRTVVRPWGTYTVLEEGQGFKLKRIVVKPGAKLSLQMHHHRSEHWVVVSGVANVTNGEQSFLLKTNESTFIPAGNKHRLENPGLVDLVLIEVQNGAYLGEDDIVRFEDSYGRVNAAV